MADSRGWPLAREAAMAADRVQPVPWVFFVLMRGAENSVWLPLYIRVSVAVSDVLWPPFRRVGTVRLPRILASGMLGVIRVAKGIRCDFRVSMASSVMR